MIANALPSPLDLSHLAQISAIEAELFHQPLDQKALHRLIARAAFRGFVLLAEDHKAVIAYALFLNAGEDADLVSVATDPAYRRQGAAAQLLTCGLASLAAESVRRVVLEVAADNLAAIELYHFLGFATVGTRVAYYSRPAGAIDALVMAVETVGRSA